MRKKKIVAMILAGGQGSRLGVMTKKVAKPAVPFGGKYKIIDYALSNCSNSGIDTVGILTQYKPQELSSHIGIGTPWDLDRAYGGVFVLPPYMTETGGSWYKGTANAIYQNLAFLDSYNPKYVLILSGDHIYKMDYREMLDAHIKNGADATIAVIDVPLEEASRFGIMNTDGNGIIKEFEEKPKNPKSTLASMGIYIFTYDKLRAYLTADAENPDSHYDFGKNIIPAMLSAGEKLIAYAFDGYWKDVGTVQSFWEANMDLIKQNEEHKFMGNQWKVYTQSQSRPSQFVGSTAEIRDSIISEGCIIQGTVRNSIIFPGVTISKDALVEDSIIMEDTEVGLGAHIRKSIIMDHVICDPDVCIGDGVEIQVIEDHTRVPSIGK